MCFLCFLWLKLSGDSERILSKCLVEFYFLDVVLREERTLRHLETLREADGNQHAIKVLELAVRGPKSQAAVREKKLHHPPIRGVDVEVSRVTFRIRDTKSTQLLLVCNRGNFVSRLVKLAQRRQPKLRQRRHLDIRHRAVRLLSIVNLFEDDDRPRVDIDAQLVVRGQDREPSGNRLRAIRRIQRNRSAQHHVLHAAKLLAALRSERRFREFERRAIGSNHDSGRRSSSSSRHGRRALRSTMLLRGDNACDTNKQRERFQKLALHLQTLSLRSSIAPVRKCVDCRRRYYHRRHQTHQTRVPHSTTHQNLATRDCRRAARDSRGSEGFGN